MLLSRHFTSIFRKLASFQVLANTFPLHATLWLCLLRLYWEFWFIYVWKILSFLHSFFQVSSNNFLFFYPEIGNKCWSILGVVTHKSWVYSQLNAFKLTEMVDYKRISLMNWVNDVKYIHLLLTFSTSASSFSWQMSFIKPFNLLISLQMLVKLLASNRIVGILYSWISICSKRHIYFYTF